jgi:hypothetical protein
MAIQKGDPLYPTFPVVAEHQEQGQAPVWWEFDPKTHTHMLSWGAKSYDTGDSSEAAAVFGAYVHGALCNAGRFD